MAFVDGLMNVILAIVILSFITGLVLIIGSFVLIAKLPDGMQIKDGQLVTKDGEVLNFDQALGEDPNLDVDPAAPVTPTPAPSLTVDPAPTPGEQAAEAAEGAEVEPFTVKYRSTISPFNNGKYVGSEREYNQKVIY